MNVGGCGLEEECACTGTVSTVMSNHLIDLYICKMT